MRGTATAAFFLGTTLIGLAMGPYLVGQISDWAGSMVNGKQVGDLRTAILVVASLVAPLALITLIQAYRTLPAAEASVMARARAAGEGGEERFA
jgi:MFS family permease